MLLPEGWTTKQHILVLLAHPDDPEFFCGGTIARWKADGHEISYCLLTKGEKGTQDSEINTNDLTEKREAEQQAAARVLGVDSVTFLGFIDGEVVNGLEQRKSVVKIIRKLRPDVIMTCDPRNLFPRKNRINHPDHIAVGQIVIEAVYPASGNPQYFPDLNKDGIRPHQVKELWFSMPLESDVVLDVTDYWELKICSLHEHQSQIGNVIEFDIKMHNRHTIESTNDSPRYEEKFKRIIFE